MTWKFSDCWFFLQLWFTVRSSILCGVYPKCAMILSFLIWPRFLIKHYFIKVSTCTDNAEPFTVNPTCYTFIRNYFIQDKSSPKPIDCGLIALFFIAKYKTVFARTSWIQVDKNEAQCGLFWICASLWAIKITKSLLQSNKNCWGGKCNSSAHYVLVNFHLEDCLSFHLKKHILWL